MYRTEQAAVQAVNRYVIHLHKRSIKAAVNGESEAKKRVPETPDVLLTSSCERAHVECASW